MPVSIKLGDTPTEKRIQRYREERDGFLFAGEFNPGGLGSTEEKFLFSLSLESNNGAKIRLGFMDYPGGWLDSQTRSEINKKRWEEECMPWINNSPILMIPIDASVLMEASTNNHRKAVPSILKRTAIQDIAREWAKVRYSNDKKESSLLIFIPLKCESYFSDNGGFANKTKSKLLYNKIRDFYEPVLEATRGEFKSESNLLHIIYAPIDTYGCVEIMDTNWKNNPVEFEAIYRLRTPHKLTPKGANYILISICYMIISNAKVEQENIAKDVGEDAQKKKEDAELDMGMWGNFKLMITGERKKRREIAISTQNKASDEEQKKKDLHNLCEAIHEISKKNEHESRVKIL